MSEAREWFIHLNVKDKHGAYEAVGVHEAEHFGGVRVIEKCAYYALLKEIERLNEELDLYTELNLE